MLNVIQSSSTNTENCDVFTETMKHTFYYHYNGFQQYSQSKIEKPTITKNCSHDLHKKNLCIHIFFYGVSRCLYDNIIIIPSRNAMFHYHWLYPYQLFAELGLTTHEDITRFRMHDKASALGQWNHSKQVYSISYTFIKTVRFLGILHVCISNLSLSIILSVHSLYCSNNCKSLCVLT